MKLTINNQIHEVLLTEAQCFDIFKMQTAQELVVYLQAICNIAEEIKTLTIDNQAIDLSEAGLQLPLNTVQALLPLLSLKTLRRLPPEVATQVLAHTNINTIYALSSLPALIKPPVLTENFQTKLYQHIITANFQTDESLWGPFEDHSQQAQTTKRNSTFETWFNNPNLVFFLKLINLKNKRPSNAAGNFFVRWVKIFAPSVIAAYEMIATATLEQKILYALVAPTNSIFSAEIITEILATEDIAVANYISLIKSLRVTQKFTQLLKIDEDNEDLREAELLKIKTTVNKRQFSYINLANISLPFVNLKNANFIGMNLTGADLSNTKLKYAAFTGTNLTNANLGGANLTDADLSGTDLSGANLGSANLNSVDFRGADLTYALFRFTNLYHAQFKYAVLKNTFFNNNLNLSNADFSEADLIGANFSSMKLSNANLTDTKLSNADLSGADLSGANLTDANLSSANLTGANFTDTDLSGTNLSKANLSGADLSNITWDNQLAYFPNFHEANLANVKMDFSIFYKLSISEDKKTALLNSIQAKTLDFLYQQIAEAKTLEKIDSIMANNRNGILYLSQTNQSDSIPVTSTFFGPNTANLPNCAKEFEAAIADRKVQLENNQQTFPLALPTHQDNEGIDREQSTVLETAEISSVTKKRKSSDELPQMIEVNKKSKSEEINDALSQENITDTASFSSTPLQLHP